MWAGGEAFYSGCQLLYPGDYQHVPHTWHLICSHTKAQYREYTDDTFTTLKPRPESDSYLGIVGPIIRAQVCRDQLVMMQRGVAGTV